MSGDVQEVTCLCCDLVLTVGCSNDSNNELLRHLLRVHKLVIANYKQIPDVFAYVSYWREKFSSGDKMDYCAVIKTNSKEEDVLPSEHYYLLCDDLPEDKTLRDSLQMTRLIDALKQQERERKSTFHHGCLFCKEVFIGKKADFFNHLAQFHNLNVGHPDNLVYTEQLIDKLENSLKRLICLNCEKVFKDRHVLKEHMRKKQHKQINPQNSSYDKFYIINYLEMGKNWKDIQLEEEGEDSDNSDWSDWVEEEVSCSCLFCARSLPSGKLLLHLKTEHCFDTCEMTSKYKLSFYQQVKLINYIRWQNDHQTCFVCQLQFCDKTMLHRHFVKSDHSSQIPQFSVWDQPEFYFPLQDDDALLWTLNDDQSPITRTEASTADQSDR